jgi:hypothetical protein
MGLATIFIAAGLMASDQKDLYVSTSHGFSIAPPVSADAANLQIAMFFLPASNNFSANVNVQKQKFSDSIEAYDKLSASQFEQLGLGILNRTLKGNEVRYEYQGKMQGRPVHWYARGTKVGGYVYLVTATGLEEQWQSQKKVLMESVDSFMLKQ